MITPTPTDLKRGLRKGKSQAQLARRYGMSPSAMCRLLGRLGLTDLPDGEVSMEEVAAALGTTMTPAYGAVERHGIRLRHWGRRRTVRQRDLDRLLAARANPIPVCDLAPQGCYTAEEIARRHGLSAGSFRTRLTRAKVRPVAYLKGKGRAVALYDLGRINRFLPTPSRPQVAPPGYLTGAEVSEITGTSRRGVTNWAQRGAPHLQCSGEGQGYVYHPLHLAEWLETTMTVEYARRKARSLRRHVADQQQGRAA